MRTAPAQRRTPAAHIADLGLGTRLAGAIRRLDARLALVGILDADQGVVGLHRLGHLVPPGSIQRRGRRPAADHGIRVAGRVLELVDRAGDGRVEFRERAHVRVEGVGVHDVERARVDLVHPEARVEIRKRRH